jgi:hypothetical protein
MTSTKLTITPQAVMTVTSLTIYYRVRGVIVSCVLLMTVLEV